MMMVRHTTIRPRTAQAFTLAELLIAISIFAIVLAAINTVLFGAIRLRDRTTDAVEKALPREYALATIKHDLSNLVKPGGVLSGSLQSTPTTNTFPGQVSPDFYSNTGTPEGANPWGDIQKISYLLVTPADRNTAGRELVRAVTRNLLATTPQPPVQQWLLSGVESMTFHYYDGTQWADAWDTTLQTNLPSAIKVQILMAQDRNSGSLAQVSPLELVIPLDIQGLTNAASTNTTTQ